MGKDWQRGKDGLEKDIDFHNQRLWKRKKYRKQQENDQKKKTYSRYKKLMELEAEEANKTVDDKKRNFYDNLFTKDENELKAAPIKKQRAKK